MTLRTVLAAATALGLALTLGAPPVHAQRRPAAARPAARPTRPPRTPPVPTGTPLGVAELNRNLRAATIAVSDATAFTRLVVRVNINGCTQAVDGTLITIIGLEAAFTDGTTAPITPPGGVETGGSTTVVDMPAPARPLRLLRISYFVGALPDCQDAQLTVAGVP